MGDARIREVWADNLGAEMARIGRAVERYRYVAMDTEFPGVVARPIGLGVQPGDYMYQTLRVNVNLLNIIQLGISLSDEHGNSPPDCACWQFNFRFSLAEDMYAQDSMELLTKSGINFSEHERNGIDFEDFGEQIMTSNLVLNPDTIWISFHSAYDFGYLLKLLTCLPLPAREPEFFELLQLFFPSIFDVKYLMLQSEELHGGLNRVAEMYDIPRVGQMHQAGSDSLLTLHVFFRMRQHVFDSKIPDTLRNVLFGLGVAAQRFNQHPDLLMETSQELPNGQA